MKENSQLSFSPPLFSITSQAQTTCECSAQRLGRANSQLSRYYPGASGSPLTTTVWLRVKYLRRGSKFSLEQFSTFPSFPYNTNPIQNVDDQISPSKLTNLSNFSSFFLSFLISYNFQIFPKIFPIFHHPWPGYDYTTSVWCSKFKPIISVVETNKTVGNEISVPLILSFLFVRERGREREKEMASHLIIFPHIITV